MNTNFPVQPLSPTLAAASPGTQQFAMDRQWLIHFALWDPSQEQDMPQYSNFPASIQSRASRGYPMWIADLQHGNILSYQAQYRFKNLHNQPQPCLYPYSLAFEAHVTFVLAHKPEDLTKPNEAFTVYHQFQDRSWPVWVIQTGIWWKQRVAESVVRRQFFGEKAMHRGPAPQPKVLTLETKPSRPDTQLHQWLNREKGPGMVLGGANLRWRCRGNDLEVYSSMVSLKAALALLQLHIAGLWAHISNYALYQVAGNMHRTSFWLQLA
ncbi:hypothetical protein OH76DRAFT_1423718 [Lentinus brumalis]|uniref:Uncharacterized protein n=1 Tax=Lentinus brumalis TaxID=2498619 RepID=A0A371CJE8_9APHY|nr:hypothetical protein OH76DRAFT_1423718 [Polyporus brumalis]